MLKGKVAIVTGSTSGIGLGIAEAFAGAGASIVLNGFGDAAEIEATRSGVASRHGVKVTYSGADMSKPAAISGMVADAIRDHGKVDILVNNAGIQFVAPIDEFPEAKWDAILAINLSSAFHATKAVLPGMKQRKWGRIINVASAHGLVASAFKSAYVAAKHGVAGFTKAMAVDLGKEGITVNAVCPGPILTGLTENIPENDRNTFAHRRTSLRRYGEPVEIAHMILNLCLPASSYVTGAVILVDGGMIARNA